MNKLITPLFLIVMILAFNQPMNAIRVIPAGLSEGDWALLDTDKYLYFENQTTVYNESAFLLKVHEDELINYYWMIHSSGFFLGLLSVSKWDNSTLQNSFSPPVQVTNQTFKVKAKVYADNFTISTGTSYFSVKLDLVFEGVYSFQNYTTRTVNGTEEYVLAFLLQYDYTRTNGTMINYIDGELYTNVTYLNGQRYDSNGSLVGTGEVTNISRMYYSPSYSLMVEIQDLPDNPSALALDSLLRTRNIGISIDEVIPSTKIVEAYVKNYYKWDPFAQDSQDSKSGFLGFGASLFFAMTSVLVLATILIKEGKRRKHKH